MPVDREARDKLLNALVAFMQREIKSDEFDERILSHTKDRAVRDIGWLLWQCYDDLIDDYLHANHELWDCLRRYAVFLQTDFSAHRVTFRVRRRRQYYALLGLVALPVATLASQFYVTWTPLIGVWTIAALAWLFLNPSYEWPQEIREAWRFSPFRDEQEWRRYEPLVERLALPLFDPAVYDKPYRTPRGEWLFMLLSRLIGAACIPLALLWAARPDKYRIYLIDTGTDDSANAAPAVTSTHEAAQGGCP